MKVQRDQVDDNDSSESEVEETEVVDQGAGAEEEVEEEDDEVEEEDDEVEEKDEEEIDEDVKDKKEAKGVREDTVEQQIARKLTRQVRDVASQVKKAKVFELRKLVRKLKQARSVQENAAKEPSNDDASTRKKKKPVRLDRMERHLEALKRMDFRVVAADLVSDIGIQVPEKVKREWSLESKQEHISVKEENNEDTDQAEVESERAFLEAALARIKSSKGVATALRHLEERLDEVSAKVFKKQKREKKLQKEHRQAERQKEKSQVDASNTVEASEQSGRVRAKKFPCGIGACGASFVAPQDRAAHWRKRHPQVYEDKIESHGLDPEDPHAHFELAELKRKKNRTGQRERKRLAMMREKEALKQQQALEKTVRNKGEKRKRPADAKDPNNNKRAKNSVSDKKPPKVEEQAVAKPEETLHPSWEAKRKAQEQASMMNEAAFQGKKITFDDSDSD